MYAGRPSLTCIADWPIGKWSAVNAASCIVSLNRHGPAANPGPGRSWPPAGSPRGSRRGRSCSRRPAWCGDHEELVGDGELHVPPGVGEELGQLGLRGSWSGPSWRRAGRTAPRPGRAAWSRVGADDLGQAAELLERVAFGDPLGAEHDVDAAAAVGQVLGHVLGRARIDRAPEDDAARRRAGAARSGRRPARTPSSTGRGTRPPACR